MVTNTSAFYITNPRVIQSKVGDGTNTKKTTIDYRYDSGTSSYLYGLPELVKVYDTDLSTVLKTQKTVYNLSSDYTSRRIIGLPSESYLYSGTDTAGTLMSKVTYVYDEGSDASLSGTTQHDGTNFGTGLNYRGNLTTTRRWDVSVPTTEAASVRSETAYNIAGSPVSQKDPRDRITTISYADDFNSSGNPTTHAYPTTITDPGGFSSAIEYRYDIGANVWARSPTPSGSGNTHGKTTSREFDTTTGRLVKQSVLNSGLVTYTEYDYANTGNALTTYSTIVDTDADGADADDEVTTLTQFDGAGRVRRTRTENPNSTGGWTASVTEYDILGRVYRKTVPTEVSVSGETWTPAGDDSAWKWNYSYYDWKDRVVRTVPSDSNGSDGKDTLIDYAGCGCAGGMVTTIKGPTVTGYNAAGSLETTAKRRMQKVYEDILGRTNKTEIWDFYENSPSTPYSTTKTTFNGRDQATLIREYSGSDSSGTYQDTTMSYDGHGRLYQKHLPQYRDGSTLKYETRTYNADDTVATVTDPRGAVATYSYGQLDSHGTEDRALPTKIAYAHSGNDYIPGDVTFAYDAAGNRTSMSDGTGTLVYSYDELSRLKTEAKTFSNKPENEPPGGYVLIYNYHLAGGIKSIEDPFENVTTYAADETGRTTDIGDGSSSTAYASGIAYRAFGGIKAMSLSTGEPINISLTYDSGQRLTGYVGGPFDAEYSYYNDGMMSGVDNQADGKFDQVSKYDSCLETTRQVLRPSRGG